MACACGSAGHPMPQFPGKEGIENGCNTCARQLYKARTESAKALQREKEKDLNAREKTMFQEDHAVPATHEFYTRTLAIDKKIEALIAEKEDLETEWKEKDPGRYQKYLELVAVKATYHACLEYGNAMYLWARAL